MFLTWNYKPRWKYGLRRTSHGQVFELTVRILFSPGMLSQVIYTLITSLQSAMLTSVCTTPSSLSQHSMQLQFRHRGFNPTNLLPPVNRHSRRTRPFRSMNSYSRLQRVIEPEASIRRTRHSDRRIRIRDSNWSSNPRPLPVVLLPERIIPVTSCASTSPSSNEALASLGFEFVTRSGEGGCGPMKAVGTPLTSSATPWVVDGLSRMGDFTWAFFMSFSFLSASYFRIFFCLWLLVTGKERLLCPSILSYSAGMLVVGKGSSII
jgi:hypothetical protein